MWAPFSVLGHYITQVAESPRPSVLVVGSGWGAHAFVSGLDRKRYKVTVLSPISYRLNQPSLIHNFPNFNDRKLSNTPFHSTPFHPSTPFIQDAATHLLEDLKKVQGQRGTYPYDYLVIATGSEAYDFKVKGVQEHCLMCKTDKDMAAISQSLRQNRRAIVLGGGPTGVELACKLQAEGVEVRILEATQAILPGFSNAMRDRVSAYLANQHLSVQTGSPVLSVTKDGLILKNETVPTQNASVIWTCGIQPAAFVRTLTGGAPLTVDPFLYYKKDIYALGDSVKGYPPTAQNARQQGIWLANHFNSGFKTDPYQYHERGRILDLTYTIFVEIQGIVWQIPYFLTPVVRWALKQ